MSQSRKMSLKGAKEVAASSSGSDADSQPESASSEKQRQSKRLSKPPTEHGEEKAEVGEGGASDGEKKAAASDSEKRVSRRQSKRVGKVEAEAASAATVPPGNMDNPPTSAAIAGRPSKKLSKPPSPSEPRSGASGVGTTEPGKEPTTEIQHKRTRKSVTGEAGTALEVTSPKDSSSKSKAPSMSKPAGSDVGSPKKDESSRSSQAPGRKLSKSTVESPAPMRRPSTKEEARSSRKVGKTAAAAEAGGSTDVESQSFAQVQDETTNPTATPAPSKIPGGGQQPKKDEKIARRQSRKLSKAPVEMTSSPGSSTAGSPIGSAKDQTPPPLSKKLSKVPEETSSRPGSASLMGTKEETTGQSKKLSKAPVTISSPAGSSVSSEALSTGKDAAPAHKSKNSVVSPQSQHTKEGARNPSTKNGKAPNLEQGGSVHSDIDSQPGSSSNISDDTSSKVSSEGNLDGAGTAVGSEAGSSDQSQTSTPGKDGKRSSRSKSRQVSDEVRKKSERMKTLLASGAILSEEDLAAAGTQEEESEEEVKHPPYTGKSHFKFLKSRCGILVDPKTWNPAWQGFMLVETEKSWRPTDEWAPTRQFIRYQGDLVIWRHERPLAQHIGWDRGCWAKF